MKIQFDMVFIFIFNTNSRKWNQNNLKAHIWYCRYYYAICVSSSFSTIHGRRSRPCHCHATGSGPLGCRLRSAFVLFALIWSSIPPRIRPCNIRSHKSTRSVSRNYFQSFEIWWISVNALLKIIFIQKNRNTSHNWTQPTTLNIMVWGGILWSES